MSRRKKKLQFAEVARILRENADADSFRGPATQEEILVAQKVLGVGLPASYIEYLREFGTSYWPEFIYVLGQNTPFSDTIISLARREQEMAEPAMPCHLIPFSPDGWGNHYCFDTSRLDRGECPVVFWNHDLSEDQEPEWIAATFLEWLHDKIMEYMVSDSDT